MAIHKVHMLHLLSLVLAKRTKHNLMVLCNRELCVGGGS